VPEQKAEHLGCIVHAINVQPDHARVALSIPPTRQIAFVVGQMKGASSFELSKLLAAQNAFAWQEDYGVFSFSERSLPQVTQYVTDQDHHHASGALWSAYEPAGERHDIGHLAGRSGDT